MEKITMIHEDEYGKTIIEREFDFELNVLDMKEVFIEWLKGQGFGDAVINRILKIKDSKEETNAEVRIATLEKQLEEIQQDFEDVMDRINFAFQNFA